MNHYLRVIPEDFQDINYGKKTNIFRKKDRDYKVNDILILNECDSDDYFTGFYIQVKIIYIQEFIFNKEECVILGFEKI